METAIDSHRFIVQESFGAFYRIEQLILSTTPEATSSPYTVPSGLPIVTDNNIKLLFRMQAEIDAIEAPVAASNLTATLQRVCYKPFGAACATQSILQVLTKSAVPFTTASRILSCH